MKFSSTPTRASATSACRACRRTLPVHRKSPRSSRTARWRKKRLSETKDKRQAEKENRLQVWCSHRSRPVTSIANLNRVECWQHENLPVTDRALGASPGDVDNR